jgi:methyl-accepting chemotaxis protein
LNRGEYETGEYKRYGKGGKEIWIQASYNPILGPNGKPIKVVKYATDITEQKIENLRQKAVVENAPTNIMFADVDLKIRYITPASVKTLRKLEHYLPVKVDNLIGENVEIFHDDPALLGALLDDPRPPNFPHRALVSVGPEKLELIIAPILDYGKLFGIVVFWDIVTARFAAEKREKERVEQDRQAAEELQRKVNSLMGYVRTAATGDLTQEITVTGSDAIGQMGDGLASFFKTVRHSVKQISQNAESVGASSEQLTGISQQMAANAEQTATQAKVVSTASGEVSRNVSVVAAGSEEMLASIREIAKSANESARVAKNAVAAAESANQTISKLGDSSVEIGKVIKVITSIAQQTNLLALNATIEAARAGEAGKGFAVVANEVKELAKATAKATEEIGGKIEAIQSDTKSAVQAIGDVGSIISQISDISNSIASAVEEQTATTNEMGRNIGEAARGANEIANNVAGVADAAQNTTTGANDTQVAAKALADMAGQLRELVMQFKI